MSPDAWENDSPFSAPVSCPSSLSLKYSFMVGAPGRLSGWSPPMLWRPNPAFKSPTAKHSASRQKTGTHHSSLTRLPNHPLFIYFLVLFSVCFKVWTTPSVGLELTILRIKSRSLYERTEPARCPSPSFLSVCLLSEVPLALHLPLATSHHPESGILAFSLLPTISPSLQPGLVKEDLTSSVSPDCFWGVSSQCVCRTAKCKAGGGRPERKPGARQLL